MDNSNDLENIRSPRKRLFETGEMKLLILHFISHSPKFSYDIIKDVAALVGGSYKPSTGTICPNISALENQGFIDVQVTDDSRKQYLISEKGLAYLSAHQANIEHIIQRFNTRIKIQNNLELLPIKQAMDQLKMALKIHLQAEQVSAETISTIAEKIQQAAHQIEHL